MKRSDFDKLMADASPTVKSSGRRAIGESYEIEDHRPPPRSKSECSSCDEPMAAAETQSGDSGLILVRITSYRQRLCDADNLMPKWHLDCCRYGKLIPDDNPKAIEFTCAQIKVAKKTEQRTEIEITYP